MAKGSNTYNYIVGFAAGVGGFISGYEIGVIGQILGMISFKTQFGLVEMHNGMPMYDAADKPIDTSAKASVESLITTTFLVGCILGAGATSILADKLGRKKSILLAGCLFATGGALQSSSSSLVQMYCGRVISGLGIGTSSMVVPVYIAETASNASRGSLTTIYQLMITLGIFIATGVNSIIITTVDEYSDLTWRLALGMEVAAAAMLVILVSLIPESPRWMADHDRNEEAQVVIAKLRGLELNDPDVVAECKEIFDAAAFDKSLGQASWSELFQGSNTRRTVIAMVNQTLQQFSGINVILYYSASIFDSMGFDHSKTAIIFPLANAFINFIATFPAMWGVERFGRKTLLIWGGLGQAIGHVGVFTFLTLSANVSDSYAWGAIISIYIFLISFSNSWGPVVWSYQSEIFPLRVRAKGTGIGTMTNWIWNAIISFGFPHVFAALNNEPKVYWIFFTFCCIMFVWSWFCVPETKGLSLEEIGAVFGEVQRDAGVETPEEK
ncbi:hypothetical protein HDU98_012027 [Podochytrium sp. JEL0797]|nr:hypothetical protein HDU98_012027 [Podochytrium sp. JEL0797]